jgi:hypothetical protein
MRRLIVALDPGDVQTAWVAYWADTKEVLAFALEPNQEVLERLQDPGWPGDHEGVGNDVEFEYAVEMIASYGMPVGKTIFDTVLWIGRFYQAITEDQGGNTPRLIVRKDVKLHLCGTPRAKDPNVTAAICNRYGGDIKRAKGTKKAPGPLYGFKSDLCAALGVAITAAETECRYTTNEEERK